MTCFHIGFDHFIGSIIKFIIKDHPQIVELVKTIIRIIDTPHV